MQNTNKYDIETIRKRLRESSGRRVDPDEFKPKKVEPNESAKYRFFILPPLMLGDELKSGQIDKSMDNFYIPTGSHWINNQPHACPRIWDGSECPICQFGFDLLKEEKDKDKRTGILKQFMPTVYYLINVFFPVISSNPEELRGVVKYQKASKTCIDLCVEAISRNDAGEKDDLKAHGVVYNENAAFLFQLEADRVGKSENNSYKKSKFIVTPETMNGTPIVANKDGSPNQELIAKVLRNRINLWTKIDIPDLDKINKVANTLINGDDAPTGGFDEDENKAASEPVASKVETKVKTESKAERKTSAAIQKPSQTSFPTSSSDLAGELAGDLAGELAESNVSSPEASIEQLLEQLE